MRTILASCMEIVDEPVVESFDTTKVKTDRARAIGSMPKWR